MEELVLSFTRLFKDSDIFAMSCLQEENSDCMLKPIPIVGAEKNEML